MTDVRSTRGYDLLVFTAMVPLYIAGYLLLRFDGLFVSHDASIMSRVAATVRMTGSLTTPPTYTNGFGYPAVVAVLSSFTGVPVSSLQRYLMPLLVVVPVLAAYVFFRGVVGDRRGFFATLLVLVHPFFLFSAFRSTHEKFTYALLLLVLYCLYASFQTTDASNRVRYIVVSYLLIGGVAFLNVYFTASFITAIAVSFGITVVVSQYYRQDLALRRLRYTLSSSSAILFTIILFLYPPASQIVSSLDSVVAETLSLFLENSQTAEATAVSPYATVGTRWDPFIVYFVLISFYFVVYPVAGLYWLGCVRQYLGRKSLDRGQLPMFFVLALFAAFGLQLAGTIVADRTGLMGANMQLRIFPFLGFVAALLTATALYPLVVRRVRTASANKQNWYGYARTTVVPLLMIVLLIGFGTTGLLKASSEPALSTNWMSTTDDERVAVEWTESQFSDEYIWSGYTPRLRRQYRLYHPRQALLNRYELNTIDIAVQYLLITDATRKHAAVGGYPLPPRESASRIYSNGGSQLYWFEQYRTLDDYNEAFHQRR